MWVQLAVYVVSAIIAHAARTKTNSAKPAVLGDFEFPQGTEGTPQIEVFGTCWISDWMVLGVGNYRTVAIRK